MDVADSTQMLKGILDGCILSIITEGEIYGYELAEKLQGYGFSSFSEGTIYPLLLRMQKDGLLSSVQRKSTAGPKRKYYSLTQKGEDELEQFLIRWAEMKGSVETVINKGAKTMNQFITINDRKIEVVQKGENGVPIFILPGMGCSFEEWFEVTEALSKTNKIIMFHRPGSGESEIGEEERTTTANAEEMKQLIERLEIVDPVILVGHSYGGLCAQHFSKLYPEKVKGLLLIDSTSEDLERLDELELPGIKGNSFNNNWLEDYQNFASTNEEELREIIHPQLTENQKKLPSHIQKQLIQFRQKPNLYKAMISEFENFKKDAKTIKNLGMLRNIPLIATGRDRDHVIQEGISRGLPESELLILENMWQQLILEQGKLSKRSTVKFAKNAGHSIHLDRPDFVITTLKELTEN